ANPDQADTDHDGEGDVCEGCGSDVSVAAADCLTSALCTKVRTCGAHGLIDAVLVETLCGCTDRARALLSRVPATADSLRARTYVLRASDFVRWCYNDTARRELDGVPMICATDGVQALLARLRALRAGLRGN